MTLLKQFFYKATPLVLFFLSFSIIITALSFLLVKPDTSEYPVSGLSMDSVEIVVRQAEVEEEAAFTNLDFLQFLEECSYHVIVVQDNPYANGALFFWNLPEQLSASFAECVPFSFLSDHESDPSMILSQTLEEQCVARGERLYYNYNNLEFEAAQFYADGDFQYDSYASLSYSLRQHGDDPLNASFHLDAGEYTDQVYQSLRRQIIATSSISEVYSYSQQEERSSFNVQNDRAYLIVILIIMGVLLILNLYHIVYFWLKNREKELFVHMLVGADWKKLCFRLLMQFGAIVMLACSIGYGSAVFLLAQEILPLDLILRGNRAAFLLSLLLILCAAVFSALLLWLRTKFLLKRKWGV